ncbi:hypothetical protein LCGC14_1371720 [marine sediment metagenome]|uniref:AAA+ ATPase domain-containing protein n=1 Tax=marine sediment metagenome TaxID=412755 RepID=A0A0F9MKH9_9ZZZZ
MNELWVMKYQPKTLEDYVFRDEAQKRQIEGWIENGVTPHLLFSGTQGIGKTSLAKVILNELKIPSADILEINASHDNGVDAFRQKVSNFVGSMPFGDFRYVLLDEADYLTLNAQAILRGLMEQFATTSRFILTCNYEHKIIPALKSRCQGFHLTQLDMDAFYLKVYNILKKEGVDEHKPGFVDTLDTYVRAAYPDLRKCINSVQQNSNRRVTVRPTGEEMTATGGNAVATGKEPVLEIHSAEMGHSASTITVTLDPPTDVDSVADYKLQMVELFKAGNINKARKLVCEQARPEEFDDIYRFLYQNLELWGNEQKQEEAILIIRNGLYMHSIVADGEINLAACLIELARLVNEK